jgi:hypothetical protein
MVLHLLPPLLRWRRSRNVRKRSKGGSNNGNRRSCGYACSLLTRVAHHMLYVYICGILYANNFTGVLISRLFSQSFPSVVIDPTRMRGLLSCSGVQRIAALSPVNLSPRVLTLPPLFLRWHRRGRRRRRSRSVRSKWRAKSRKGSRVKRRTVYKRSRRTRK